MSLPFGFEGIAAAEAEAHETIRRTLSLSLQVDEGKPSVAGDQRDRLAVAVASAEPPRTETSAGSAEVTLPEYARGRGLDP